MNRVEIEPVDRVQITVLMDNVTDPLLIDQEAVARMSWPKAILGGLPTAQARVSPVTGVPDALVAEPGFSALLRVEKAGRTRTLLFDTGVSPNGMVENMRRIAWRSARRGREGRRRDCCRPARGRASCRSAVPARSR